MKVRLLKKIRKKFIIHSFVIIKNTQFMVTNDNGHKIFPSLRSALEYICTQLGYGELIIKNIKDNHNIGRGNIPEIIKSKLQRL